MPLLPIARNFRGMVPTASSTLLRARSLVQAALVLATVTALGPFEHQAHAAPDDGIPVESFWSTSFDPGPEPTPAERAKRAYVTTLRIAEEARIASELGRYYVPTHGLSGVRVECTPVCGITELLDAGPAAPTVDSLRQVLRQGKPAIVGTKPERGLGAPPRTGPGRFTWYPRSVHRRFPCDCDVVVHHREHSILFQALDGAESLPDDVRYTRGEAKEAALRQLEALGPEPTSEPTDPVLVVSAGNRARLVHRFVFRLEGKERTVDVEDATLEVVKLGEPITKPTDDPAISTIFKQ
jgi:hypothetical protein